MADASVPMTSKGYQFLVEELKRLKTIERPKNIREIEEARGHGDLSENAEFHAAKERQSLLDVQIREIEDKIARAQVIDVTKLSRWNSSNHFWCFFQNGKQGIWTVSSNNHYERNWQILTQSKEDWCEKRSDILFY